MSLTLHHTNQLRFVSSHVAVGVLHKGKAINLSTIRVYTSWGLDERLFRPPSTPPTVIQHTIAAFTSLYMTPLPSNTRPLTLNERIPVRPHLAIVMCHLNVLAVHLRHGSRIKCMSTQGIHTITLLVLAGRTAVFGVLW